MVADPRRSRARSRSPVHVRSRRPMRPVSVRSIPARRGSGSLAGSKRNVVLYPLSHGPDLLDQVGEIAAVLDEVDVRAVDHQERGLRVTVKVVPERLRQPLQVLRGDAALEVPVALAELAELALPAIALEQEEELGLEGMTLRVLVEFPEEGILLDLLEEEPRPELGGEPSREGRLADADESLDRDVPPRGPVRRHPHPEREIAGPTRRVYGGEPATGSPCSRRAPARSPPETALGAGTGAGCWGRPGPRARAPASCI